MGTLLRDIRFSLRLFAQNRAFTAVPVLSLALGIGANTTIFSVLNAILLRPFPVKDQDRLVVLHELNWQRFGQRNPTAETFYQWQAQVKSFESMALTDTGGSGPATLTSEGGRIGDRRNVSAAFRKKKRPSGRGRCSASEAGLPSVAQETDAACGCSCAILRSLDQRQLAPETDGMLLRSMISATIRYPR